MVSRDRIISFYKEHCVYLPAMLGWFFFSTLLSCYNKKIFGKDHLGFPFPLLLTSFHFLIQWMFSHLACLVFPVELGAERIDQMTWAQWASISIPCGMATALDVGLSNLSMVTITITFYTMVKSSTPIFVLCWAYAFGIERITWRLVGVIVVIACGECLTVWGEYNFVMRGFLLCLGASFLSGARWTLVQSKLQNLRPRIQTTIATMRLLAPSMFILMLLMSFTIEKPWTKLSDYRNKVLELVFLGVLGGSLAVSMVLFEFYLILHSSAMILMIGGVIKEMTTIVIGVTYFHDKLNSVNVSGILVVFSGVILYKIVFHLDRKHDDDHVHEHLGGDKHYDPHYAEGGPMELIPYSDIPTRPESGLTDRSRSSRFTDFPEPTTTDSAPRSGGVGYYFVETYTKDLTPSPPRSSSGATDPSPRSRGARRENTEQRSSDPSETTNVLPSLT